MEYKIVITEIQRQVLLDALDLAIEQDFFVDRTEDQQASDIREMLELLPNGESARRLWPMTQLSLFKTEGE